MKNGAPNVSAGSKNNEIQTMNYELNNNCGLIDNWDFLKKTPVYPVRPFLLSHWGRPGLVWRLETGPRQLETNILCLVPYIWPLTTEN
jgi:hypothetical protein